MLREAHPPDRRSTVAHFMQTSLSSSSAFLPSASFPSPGTRLAWTTTKQRALLQSAPSEFDYHLLKKCNVSAYCLRLLHANAPSRCSHPRGHCRPVCPRACSSCRAYHPHGGASLPTVLERPLPSNAWTLL